MMIELKPLRPEDKAAVNWAAKELLKRGWERKLIHFDDGTVLMGKENACGKVEPVRKKNHDASRESRF